MVKKRKKRKKWLYQDGGYTDYDIEVEEENGTEGSDEIEETEDSSLVFDSTDGDSSDALEGFDMLDALPMDDEGGINIGMFEPTMGNESHSVRPMARPLTLALSYLEDLGIKPSSTNTGKHNVGSKHYSGKAFDLGLNTSFGGSLKKMHEFRDNFEKLRETNPLFQRFRLHDETVRPRGQKVWGGAHLHLELID